MNRNMRNMPACQTGCSGGTSPDVCVCGADTSARVDLNIVERFAVTITGQVINQCGCPAVGATLCLMRVCGDGTREVAQTCTDGNGCYQLNFQTTDCKACYRVMVAS